MIFQWNGVIIFINITFTNKIKYTLKCFKWHNPLAGVSKKEQATMAYKVFGNGM